MTISKRMIYLSLGAGALAVGLAAAVPLASAGEKKSEKKAEPRAAEAAPAVATVGKPAPEFTLADQHGKRHSLAQYRGKTVVLEWTNPGCPFVKRHYGAKMTMKELAAKHGDVVWLAVNSTASNKPEDSKKWSEDKGIAYPTLQDPEGTVGKLYGARTTPHMYVIDEKGVLRYAGAIDDDAAGKAETPRNYVGAAVLALAAGKDPNPAQTEPYGCTVKYKK